MLNSMLVEKVNKNLIFYKDLKENEIYNILEIADDKSQYFCFDTESCADIRNLEHERVYSWGWSNTVNDMVIYGHTLEDFLSFIKILSDKKFFLKVDKKKKKLSLSFNCFVHNLGWDIEFFRYTLPNNNFTYDYDLVKDGKKINKAKSGNTFNITENDGIVYSADINFDNGLKPVLTSKKEYPFITTVNFYDSFKLVPQALDQIGKQVIKIDDFHNKLGNLYDYKKVREINHVLDEIEKCYLYNDVYILKEFIKQYYIAHNLKGKTASGIAFNNLLNFKYEGDKLYQQFEHDYPKITDTFIKNKLISPSYQGGFTYTSPYIKGKHLKNISGYSIDINSSYPSRMQYEKLPYGIPKYFKGSYKKDEEYDIYFQRVRFDGFKRKQKSKIGFIKIGGNCICNNNIIMNGEKIRKNEYVDTNIDNEGNLVTHSYEMVLTGEEMKFLEQHYEFYNYKRIRNIDGDEVLTKRIFKKGLIKIDGCKFKSRIGDFSDFIDDCMFRKNLGKEMGNEIMTLIAKTDANSTYGKLGSSPERIVRESYINDKGIASFREVYEKENINDFDYLEEREYYRAYSSFVTSYGRLSLWRVISYIEQNLDISKTFLYCDTDSLYLDISYEDLLNLPIELNPTKLGAWDIEKEFSEGKFIGAKKYMVYGRKYGKDCEYDYTVKCAGLPKVERDKIRKFTDFAIGKSFNKKAKKKVIGGYRIVDTIFTISDFSFM